MSHDYCPGHAPMDQPAGDSTDRRAIECPLCQILVIDDINEQRQAAYTALCEAAALPIIEYYSALTPSFYSWDGKFFSVQDSWFSRNSPRKYTRDEFAVMLSNDFDITEDYQTQDTVSFRDRYDHDAGTSWEIPKAALLDNAKAIGEAARYAREAERANLRLQQDATEEQKARELYEQLKKRFDG